MHARQLTKIEQAKELKKLVDQAIEAGIALRLFMEDLGIEIPQEARFRSYVYEAGLMIDKLCFDIGREYLDGVSSGTPAAR